jgi:hypothetical protein
VTASERVAGWLASPRLPIFAALLAALLTASSLGMGLATEDYLFRAAVQRPLTLDDVNLYDAEDVAGGVALARRLGSLPWLTPDEFRISFWRPLASLTHFVDYRLWPGPTWRFHLESVLCYALLAAVVALLYRRILGASWVAGAAALMYAVDDAHGPAVGWLANRHAVLGALLGALALWLHDRWRRDGSHASALLSWISLAAALAASELAISAVLLIAAHAATLDPAARARRFLPALPALAIGVAWAIFTRALGHGATASGTYLDPLREPGAYLAALPERAGTLLLGQLAAPAADTWHLVGPAARTGLALGGWLAFAAVLVALAGRLRRGPEARFLALATLLALLPIAGTFPSDRLLFFAGIGATGLVALVLGRALAAAHRRQLPLTLLASLLLIVHALVAPLSLPVRTLKMAELHRDFVRASDSAYAAIRAPDELLIVMNAPDYYFCKMLRELRWTRGHADAVPLLCVAGTLAPTEVTSLDPNAFEVRPAHGFLDRPFNRTYRGRTHPMRQGESVFTGSAQIVVTAVSDDGAPEAASFRFVYPLESDKLRFVAWKAGSYAPFSPPLPGQSVVLAP